MRTLQFTLRAGPLVPGILAAALLIFASVPAAGRVQDEEESGPDILFPRAVDHNLHPEMVIKSGTLVRDLRGGWSLGTLPLVFTGKSRIGGPGDTVESLREGRPAFAMGALRGGVLFVHYISLVPPDQARQRGTLFERSVPGAPTIVAGDLPQ